MKNWPELRKEFPSLYDNIVFECCGGWYDLLRDLSIKIEAHMKCCPDYEGEHPLKFYVTQVKEKYATLRFYCENACEHIDVYIDEAEERSAKTCEDCGEPGTLRGAGWYRTQCDRCFNNEEHLETMTLPPKFIDPNDPQG